MVVVGSREVCRDCFLEASGHEVSRICPGRWIFRQVDRMVIGLRRCVEGNVRGGLI